jgi:RNA polymerase sigma-70 factor (ECF subfamily)
MVRLKVISPAVALPLSERSDEDLMLLVRAGSREGMAALIVRHIGPLTSFCAKWTGDAGAAEDVVQEALLRLWRHRAEWRPRGRFVALLYTTARNLCRNRARDMRRRTRWVLPEAGNLDATAADIATDIDPLLARERRRDVVRALGELPEAMRESLVLRFDGELPYESISAIVGAPESTVRSRVHHGLMRLRALLDAEEEKP